MINLIPPQLKREKAIQRKIGYFSIGVAGTLLFVMAATLLMVAYNQFAQTTVRDLQTQAETTKLASKQYASVEAVINKTNTKLLKLDTVNKKRVLWSNVLTEFANDTPVYIQLKNVSFDRETGKILLTGTARDRKDIADFKEKLEMSTFFKNVFFSSSSLNEVTTDYSFSLSAELENPL